MENMIKNSLIFGNKTGTNKKFKPSLEVLVRLARVLIENQSVLKTHLHIASRVKWSSFACYLTWLTENRIVQCNGLDETYALTKNGRNAFTFLLKFNDIVRTSEHYLCA
ncbi:MAG: hypothetical protein HZA84_04425 [Thaumarchaeota archaeon]|nr:hypothetical protein [Nitrososphaerota archaeon]